MTADQINEMARERRQNRNFLTGASSLRDEYANGVIEEKEVWTVHDFEPLPPFLLESWKIELVIGDCCTTR